MRKKQEIFDELDKLVDEMETAAHHKVHLDKISSDNTVNVSIKLRVLQLEVLIDIRDALSGYDDDGMRKFLQSGGKRRT